MSVCVVRGCSSSGHHIYVFPEDEEMREKWFNSFVGKERYREFNKSLAGICSKHFKPSDFEEIELDTMHGELKFDAVPSQNLFRPGQCLTITLDMSDSEEDDLVLSIVKDEEEVVDEADVKVTLSDYIQSFLELQTEYRNRINASLLEKYSIECLDKYITFYKLDFEPNGQVSISTSITISRNLNITVFAHGEQVTESSNELQVTGKINLYSKLQDILQAFVDFKSNSLRNSPSFKNNLALSIYALDEILKSRQELSDSDTELTVTNINTIKDQLLQIQNRDNKFSVSTIVNCFNIHAASPDAYEYLRTLMFLPKANELKELMKAETANMSTENTEGDQGNVNEVSSDEGSDVEMHFHSCK
ncbi:uncharacterized protein LOC129802332 [Phlebotomus papatasi]|uniref:uncharacterized protein LOC129802332 n=1 Tax=Phlebotomus papatasi TaxID=29031 RepID=UPI0024840503|nr:uncharacterized protein LOC129802332 [Phlebotomus papatasi]